MNDKPSYQELENQIAELKKQNKILHQKFSVQKGEKANRADELEKFEEKYKGFVSHSPDIIYKYSNKRGGLFWSNRVEEILGYSPTEIVNNPFLWNNSIHPEDKEKVQKAIENNEKGEDYNIEYRIKTKQGKYVWLHDIFMHKTQVGDEIIIEGHAADITARKDAELALKESEKLLSAISRNYPNSFVSVINKDLTVGFTCGEEFYKLNLNPDDYVGLSLKQVFGKNTETVKKHYLKAFAGEKTSFELIIGNQHQLYKAVPLYDENNKIPQILAVAENIAEKKLAEQKIQASEERLNSYINSTSDVVFTLDTEQRHTGVFGNWYKKSGMQASDFIGKTAKEILGESSTIHEEANKKALEGELVIYEWCTKTNKTEVYYQTSLSPLKNKDNEIIGIIGVGRDITTRKEIEDELNKTVSLLTATLESTVDGILVVDESRKTFTYNKKFLELWQIPDSVISTHDDKQLVASILHQLSDPDSFLKKVEEMYQSEENSFDVLNFKDGRIYERYSKPQILDEKSVGRVWSFRDVTAYNKAVDAMRLSENKYRTLVDEVNEGFFISDEQAVLTFVNRAMAKILGFEHPDEVLGKKFTSFLPPEKVNELFGRYQRAMKSGTTTKALSTKIIWQDGTTRYIEINPQLIFKDGKPTGSSGLIQDITERKQAEDALKENQRRFEKSQALGHVGNWDYNFISDEFWVSNESKRIFGLNPDSNNFSAEQVESAIPERERVHQALIDLIERDKKYDLEYEIIPADNTPRKIIRSIAELERDESNNPLRVRGVILDITEQKKAEQTLRASQENLSEAQAIAHLGHWELDVIGNKLTWSDEIYKIFELDPLTFNANYETFLEAIHPDDRDTVSKAYNSSVENRTPYKIDHRIQMTDGRVKYVHEHCKTYYNAEGKPLRSIGTVQDITKRKQAEEVLHKSQEKLLQAQYISGMGDFTWNVVTGVVTWSDGMHRLLKYDKNEDIDYNKVNTEIHHPDDLERVTQWLNDSIASGEEFLTPNEYRLIRKDGQIIDVQTNGQIEYIDGKVAMLFGTCLDITERKQAEEIIATQKRRLANILKGTNVGTWEWNIQTGETVFDERWAEILGYQLEEMSPASFETWMKFSHPDDLIVSGELLEKHFNGELDYYECETRMKHKNGDWKWVLDRGKVHQWDDEGKPLLMSGTHQDITERKQVEEELIKKKEQLELVMQGSNIGWWDWDIPSGDEIFNDILAENLGYKLSKIEPNVSWREDKIHPDDAEQVNKNLQEHFDGKTEYYINKHRLKTKSEKWKWFVDHGKVVEWDKNGKPIRMIGTLKDIDKQEKGEIALLESEEKYRRMVENMNSGIAIYQPIKNGKDFRFIDFNKAAERITNSSAKDVIGNTLLTLFPNMDKSPLFKALQTVNKSGEDLYLPPFFYKDKQREGWRENHIYKLPTGEIITIFDDVTKRKNAEINLHKQNDKLVIAKEKAEESEDKLKELNAQKDKFFSVIAHDLKSPFNSIVGFSGLLVEQVREKDYNSIEKYAGIIEQSSNRAMNLLMNLMEWARSQTGRMEFNPEYFEMVSLTNKTTLLYDDIAAQKTISIVRNLPANAPIFADKAMISTVLRNLISNAVKFTHSGGEITISAQENQNELKVSVSDNGVGLSKTNIQKIFRIEENYTTSGTNKEKGTGLGLILCKEFIEKHEGNIWVESEEGKGSTFIFTIPKVNNENLSK